MFNFLSRPVFVVARYGLLLLFYSFFRHLHLLPAELTYIRTLVQNICNLPNRDGLIRQRIWNKLEMFIIYSTYSILRQVLHPIVNVVESNRRTLATITQLVC